MSSHDVPPDVDPAALRGFVGRLLVKAGFDAKLTDDGARIRMDKVVNCRLSRTLVDTDLFSRLGEAGWDGLVEEAELRRKDAHAKVYIFVFPGRLPEERKEFLLDADIRPWDMPGIIERFGGSLDAEEELYGKLVRPYLE